jgi:hypothetical protein
MNHREAKKIEALSRLLPDWHPLWEQIGDVWRLVYLSPELIAQYRALCRAAAFDASEVE